MIARALAREVWQSAGASRAYSLLFSCITGLAVLVVVLAVGQAQAQRDAVTALFGQPEYRTVTVIDEQDRGVVPWTAAELATRLSTVERPGRSVPPSMSPTVGFLTGVACRRMPSLAAGDPRPSC